MKRFSKESKEPKKSSFFSIILFLIMIWLISIIVASFFTLNEDEKFGNVAIIKLYGTISTTDSSGFLSDDGVSSNEIVALLDEAEKDPSVKAIVLDINSGGGSPVGSDEIGRKLRSINKTKVAWVRDIGASGAYWVASNTDYIVANRLSLVGSIGVTGSYLDFSKLLKDYNITYRRLVSGKYKDSGSPLKELTPDEEQMIQNLIDELHGYFVLEVANNRNLSEENVRSLATGEVFSGQKGYELGLVDKVGGIEEVTVYLEHDLNTTVEYKTLEKEESFTDLLRKISAEHGFAVGEGMRSFLYDTNPVIKT